MQPSKRMRYFQILPYFLSLLFVFSVGAYASPSQPPFYLSYEQRILISYFLEAAEASASETQEIGARLKKFVSKQIESAEVKTVEVKSFKTFLKHFRGEWPNSQSLKEDLEILEAQAPRGILRYVAKNEKLQQQISDFLAAQQVQFKKLIISQLQEKLAQHLERFFSAEASLTVNKEDLNKKVKSILNTLADVFQIPNRDGVFGFSDKRIELVTLLMKQTVNSTPVEIFGLLMKIGRKQASERLNEMNRAGDLVSQELMEVVKDPMVRIFFATVIQEYFKRLPLEMKKEIASQYLGENLNMEHFEKFSIMVQNSGPVFQKFLQVSSLLKELPSVLAVPLKALQDSVRPVASFKVKRLIQNKKERLNYKIVSYREKPLGVGTINQVHRGRIVNPQNKEVREVVFSFIKPGIIEKFSIDRKIFTELVIIMDHHPELIALKAPRLEPIVEDVFESMQPELNQTLKVKQHQEGRKNYHQRTDWIQTEKLKFKVIFQVPELILPATDSTELTVTELSLGKPLKKSTAFYNQSLPELSRLLNESTAKLWTQVGLFETGFFHADLHPGNMLVRINDAEIIIDLLDFGMIGKLEKNQLSQTMVLGAALELLQSGLLAKAFWNLSDPDKNALSFEEFHGLVKAKIKEMQRNHQTMGPNEWTSWATQVGVKLNKNYISLQRGVVILDTTLENDASKLSFLKISMDLAKKSPFKMLKYLTQDENSLTFNELFELGWKQVAGEKLRIDHKPVVDRPSPPLHQTQQENNSQLGLSITTSRRNGDLQCRQLFQ